MAMKRSLARVLGCLPILTLALAGAVSARPQFNAPYYCYPVPSYAIRVADVNGDGKQDLIAAVPDGIDVLLGDGHGSFEPASHTSTGEDLRALEVVDLNADGRLDVVAVNPTGNSLRVLFGAPGGTLGSAASVSVGGFPYTLVVRDMDADGILDFVVGGSPIKILRGDGAGNFAAWVDVTHSGIASVGNLNGDALPDLVVGEGTSVLVLTSSAPGAFALSQTIVLEEPAAVIRVAELNGDANQDIAVGNYNGLFRYYGDGSGAFSSPARIGTNGHGTESVLDIAIGDVDGSGVQDVVAAFESSINRYVGVFNSGARAMQGELVRSLSLGDVDGDSDLDIVGVGSCGIELTLNKGTGTFGAERHGQREYPKRVSAADLNNDGKADLLGTYDDYELIVTFISRPDGGRDIQEFGTYLDATHLGAFDLDQDGSPEILAGTLNTGSGWVTVVERGPGGTYLAPENFQAASDTVVIGDRNGDGYPEAVRLGWELLVGEPGGGYAAPVPLPGAGSKTVLADFDKDGTADRASVIDGKVERGDGAGEFILVETLGLGIFPEGIVAADFDGDGYLDLAVSNRGSDENNDGAFTILRNLTADVMTPTLVSWREARESEGGVLLSWRFPEPTEVRGIVRRDAVGREIRLGRVALDALTYSVLDNAVLGGETYRYRLEIARDGQISTDDLEYSVPMVTSHVRLTVSWSLGAGVIANVTGLGNAGARLALVDVAGRTLSSRDLGGSADAVIVMPSTAQLAPGLYWVRLTGRGPSLARRVIVSR